MSAYRYIPILTDDSLRVLSLKTSHPKITVFEIAAKTLIPVQDVDAYLRQLRRAKLLNYTFRPMRAVK